MPWRPGSSVRRWQQNAQTCKRCPCYTRTLNSSCAGEQTVKTNPGSSRFSVLCILLVAFVVPAVSAEDILIPQPPELPVKAYILQDFYSGRILAESHADERLEPASLTKIMTAYVVFSELKKGRLKLGDMVTVSEKAWRTEGSRMFARVGAQISVEDLLKGMIVQSGNDASVALAEHVAGDESVFAQMMNQHAARLGMVNTHFKNSMGLPDPDHYATAHDLALLTRALIDEFPEYYPWHAIKEFLFNGIKQTNRNKLLWRDASVDGVKTGHTDGAGYCLVASALRDNDRLISVVLGARTDNDRASANQSLLNYGFRFFETRQIYPGREKLADVRIWKGAPSVIGVGPARAVFVTYPRGKYSELAAGVDVNETANAPVAEGDKLGTVRVMHKDELVTQQDLVALQPAVEGGIFRRMWDQLLLWTR
ncbi:MAG: hypothetical protein RIQ52_1846 [Pseudomonadota bacterium]